LDVISFRNEETGHGPFRPDPAKKSLVNNRARSARIGFGAVSPEAKGALAPLLIVEAVPKKDFLIGADSTFDAVKIDKKAP
jgi:hypothetical protein